jgi:hypothetical protein
MVGVRLGTCLPCPRYRSQPSRFKSDSQENTKQNEDWMTNYSPYEVAAYKLWVLNRTAQLLGIDREFLDGSELTQRIEHSDSEAAQKLDRFFKAYDEWYDLSSRMIEDETLRANTTYQDELGDKIHERDEERSALLAYLMRDPK